MTRLVTVAVALCVTFTSSGFAQTQTFTAKALGLGCRDQQLFRELMIVAKEDWPGFLSKSLNEIDHGNCRWLQNGEKLILEKREGSILIQVHELGTSGSYWTSTLFVGEP
jgi:hypothetical protein